jgi:phasin
MNESFNPLRAADKAGNTAPNLENLALNNPMSEAIGALAERNLAQSREAYDRSKEALEVGLETLERSFDALGQGATALNHKVMDIAQRNINSSFDLGKKLAGAKNLAQIVELQAAHWRKQFEVLAGQAEEVRVLSTQVAAEAVKPANEQLARAMDKWRKAG